MTRPAPPFQLAARATDAHKGDFGRVALVGGSRGMAGSIALSSIAALKTGSGLVTALVPDRCLETVAGFHPCVMTIPLADDAQGRFSERAAEQLVDELAQRDAVGCGPGMTTCIGSQRLVQRLLHRCQTSRPTKLSVVLDADAINVLAMLDWARCPERVIVPLVLTPHPGELQRLSGVSAGDRTAQIAAAQQLAAATNTVIVVKGGPTVVVDAQRRWVNDTGNPGMATAGSGDVLTGIITSLLGQDLPAWDAACLGVWLHGCAGDLAAARLGGHSLTAVDLLDDLSQAVREAATQ